MCHPTAIEKSHANGFQKTSAPMENTSFTIRSSELPPTRKILAVLLEFSKQTVQG